MSDSFSVEPREAVAVIGMAGRFPGASDLKRYWDNLRRGVESISFFNDGELLATGTDPALLSDPSFVRARGILKDVDLFDAEYFGFQPREAEITDPQHRLFLESAVAALQDAGYDGETPLGRVGVFAGTTWSSYLFHLLANRADIAAVSQFQILLGNDKDYLATRLAYKLNLRGPALTVQTSCSTSLTAICLACQSLLNGESDMALAGGVSIKLPQRAGYLYQEGGITSPDGHTRAFDAEARGCAGGNGVGTVLLKRLSEAVADRDHIYAVVKGFAMNNDGSGKVGYTAPSVRGQAEAIAEAMALAEIDPATLGYVEAHGTATALGDPVELQALSEAFGVRDRKGFCGIGSVKSNFGHLDAAAGVAGFIKAVLALHHGLLPPSLHFHKPNPAFDLENSPFYVVAEPKPWPRKKDPRRAGVSSFGIGGTNVHMVLEEAPVKPEAGSSPSRFLLFWSARDRKAVETMSLELADYLEANPSADLADVGYTLATGRKRFPHQRLLVCRDRTQALAMLRGETKGLHSRTAPANAALPAFLFPGQGALRPNTARGLYHGQRVFRERVDTGAELVSAELGRDLREILFPVPGNEANAAQLLTRTEFGQPALFLIEVALAELLRQWGVRPHAVMGHSLGEYAAACVAGVFSFEDGLRLVAARGRLMQELPRGAMLAVSLSEEEVRGELRDDLSLAAINGPARCVVSGHPDTVAALRARLEERGRACLPLATDRAFHGPTVEAVTGQFGQLLRNIRLRPPVIPVVSNLTGVPLTASEALDPDYWCRHSRYAVRFAAGLAELLNEPNRLLLELGPGRTLTGLARQHPSRKPGHSVLAGLAPVPGGDEEDGLLACLGRLWLAGVAVDWDAVYGESSPRRLPLPGYPFQRKRFWIGPPESGEAVAAAAATVQPEPRKKPIETAKGGDTLQILLAIFREITGADSGEVDTGATFFQLGADSLMLIQATQTIRQRMGVTVPLNRLFDDLSTLETLAAHVGRERARAPLSQAVETEPPPTEPPTAPSPPAAETSEPLSDLQNLGPGTRHALDTLIRRFNARTPGSKEMAQRYRAVLADPRASMRFRLAWKELVYPIVAVRSEGSRIWDADGGEYVDFAMGFGVHLFGHNPHFVTRALQEQLSRGMQLGPRAEAAGEVAALVSELTGLDRVAFCNTGTEAVMAALRLARVVTGRHKIAWFAGSYHGGFDGVLARPNPSGDGSAVPLAPGVPPNMVRDAVVLAYGEPESLERIAALAPQLAAVLVEPVQSRRPDFQPRAFLQELRRLTRTSGTALIFDEVITGFRIHPGGAQAHFDVRADLAVYGKVVGGGLPIGLIAGAARFMDAIDGGAWDFGDDSFPRAQQTFFAGTFNKNPLTVAAARAVLRHLRDRGPDLQQTLNQRTDRLARELNAHFEKEGYPVRIRHFGSLFSFDFPRESFFQDLFNYFLLEKGIYVWEGGTRFLSTAHGEADLDLFYRAVTESLAEMRVAGFLPEPELASKAAERRPGMVEALKVPLTDGQKQIWAVSRLGEEAGRAYHESVLLRFRGELRLTALHAAFQALVERHQSLRATVCERGTWLRIEPEIEVDLPLEDLTALAERERTARLTEWKAFHARSAFDLERGPLLRLGVARLAEDRHVLAVTMHHIVTDGWSNGILLHELRTLYAAACKGEPPRLPPPARYSDYAARAGSEGRATGQPDSDADRRYWLDLYAEAVPVLSLPTAGPRPSRWTFAGASERLSLPPALRDGLHRLGADHGCTLYMVLLAGFQILLHRLNRGDEIVVGISAAGQSLIESGDHLVGYCVNVLPLRSRFRQQMHFPRFLGRTQSGLLGAHAHQAYSYGQLLRDLNLPRDPSRPPLISAYFNLDRSGDTPPDFHGIAVETEANFSGSVRWELTWNLTDRGNHLDLDCYFKTALFEPATVRRWMAAYEALLTRLVEDPDTSLGDLDRLLAETDEKTRDRDAAAFREADAAFLKKRKRGALAG